MSSKTHFPRVLWHAYAQREQFSLAVAAAKGGMILFHSLGLKVLFKILSDQKSIFKFELYALVEVKPECYVDDDCATSDICNKGSCVDACRLSHCGSNAICEAGYHSAKCVCLPGFTGDPRTACNKCKLDFHTLRISTNQKSKIK